MKISLLYYESESDVRQREEDSQNYWAAWGGYIQAIHEAGIFAGGEGLQPPAFATTLRGGQVQDGPYADTKDQLSGFVIIDVPTLDDAMAWAAKAPCEKEGAVEIRPVLEMAP